MDATTEVCTKDRLRQMADKPGVTVYEYVTDTASEIMPPEQQLDTYRAILAGFDAGTFAHPDEDEEHLRERIMAASPAVRKFQRLYAKVFASVTVRVHDSDTERTRLDRVRKAVMLMLLEKVSAEGSEDEVAARVLHHSLRLAMRDATAEDFSQGTVLQHGKDLPAEASKVTPLHPDDLGASSVKQPHRRVPFASAQRACK